MNISYNTVMEVDIDKRHFFLCLRITHPFKVINENLHLTAQNYHSPCPMNGTEAKGGTPVLRCSICRQAAAEALELISGPICRNCLRERTVSGSLDELAALLCAAVVTDDQTTKEDAL